MNDLIQRLRGAADGTLRPVHAYSLCAEAADALAALTDKLADVTRERDEQASFMGFCLGGATVGVIISLVAYYCD
jgi:hypothetical protein